MRRDGSADAGERPGRGTTMTRGAWRFDLSDTAAGEHVLAFRFMADVVAPRPRRVHILCGTNDIARNTGPTTPEDYRCNMLAMIDLAAAHGIAVLLASIPPAATIA